MQSFYNTFDTAFGQITDLTNRILANVETGAESPEDRIRGESTAVAIQTDLVREAWSDVEVEDDEETAGSNAGDIVHSSSAPEDGELEEDRVDRRQRKKNTPST